MSPSEKKVAKTRIKKAKAGKPSAFYDRGLMLATFGIVIMGLLMVASSSIVISDNIYHQPFHFLAHQLVYLAIGVIAGVALLRVEMCTWQKLSGPLLLFSMALLVLVLIPGLGRTVNGSSRWLGFGPVGLQVSELVKLSVILYMSAYLVRREQEVQQHVSGFIKPMIVLGVIAVLLLKEPDFGATVVIMCTTLGMLFLAGVRLWQFGVLISVCGLAIGILAIPSPYRLLRLTSFLNPWANQYDSGYQLTQSLIAFGRGGWLGVGLGESVQKMFYLPEAHTDFLFAVLAEELGLLGIIAVFALFILFIGRIFSIGRKAVTQDMKFSGFVAFGIALWLGLQAMINIGVNSGVLPTKGLTLPLMSYGGSSMLISCVAIAILFRIDFENRR